MHSRFAILLLAFVLMFVGGCGNSGEKGKNKTKDVPKNERVEPG